MWGKQLGRGEEREVISVTAGTLVCGCSTVISCGPQCCTSAPFSKNTVVWNMPAVTTVHSGIKCLGERRNNWLLAGGFLEALVSVWSLSPSNLSLVQGKVRYSQGCCSSESRRWWNRTTFWIYVQKYFRKGFKIIIVTSFLADSAIRCLVIEN